MESVCACPCCGWQIFDWFDLDKTEMELYCEDCRAVFIAKYDIEVVIKGNKVIRQGDDI